MFLCFLAGSGLKGICGNRMCRSCTCPSLHLTACFVSLQQLRQQEAAAAEAEEKEELEIAEGKFLKASYQSDAEIDETGLSAKISLRVRKVQTKIRASAKFCTSGSKLAVWGLTTYFRETKPDTCRLAMTDHGADVCQTQPTWLRGDMAGRQCGLVVSV